MDDSAIICSEQFIDPATCPQMLPDPYPGSVPIALTIAASDSSGGAGTQADLKAMSATGCYACSAITALTSQNTRSISAVLTIPPQHIASQLDAIFADIKIQAVKVGLLFNAESITIVVDKITQYTPPWIVIDPIMVNTNGQPSQSEETTQALITQLLPLANLITPNVYEAAILSNRPCPQNDSELIALAKELKTKYRQSILIKGGALTHSDTILDILVHQQQIFPFMSDRVTTEDMHGTGCSLSSAITSYLAQGYPLTESISYAKHYITGAIQAAQKWQIGQGKGPIRHFFQWTPTC